MNPRKHPTKKTPSCFFIAPTKPLEVLEPVKSSPASLMTNQYIPQCQHCTQPCNRKLQQSHARSACFAQGKTALHPGARSPDGFHWMEGMYSWACHGISVHWGPVMKKVCMCKCRMDFQLCPLKGPAGFEPLSSGRRSTKGHKKYSFRQLGSSQDPWLRLVFSGSSMNQR